MSATKTARQKAAATATATEEATAPDPPATEATTDGSPPVATPPTEVAAELPPPYYTGLTIGRIVHFVMEEGYHRPAIVIEHDDAGHCGVRVFTGPEDRSFGGLLYSGDVEPDPTGLTPATWHWPERA